MEQENELGVKPIKKLLWKLAVPAITGGTCHYGADCKCAL